MSPPANTVLRRIDDISEVRCLLNGLTSSLQCVGGRWNGDIGVCERPSVNVQSLGDSLLDSIDVYYNVTYNYIASLHPGIIYALYALHMTLLFVKADYCTELQCMLFQRSPAGIGKMV